MISNGSLRKGSRSLPSDAKPGGVRSTARTLDRFFEAQCINARRELDTDYDFPQLRAAVRAFNQRVERDLREHPETVRSGDGFLGARSLKKIQG